FVFNYAKAYRQFGDERYRALAAHGLDYLRRVHRDRESGGSGGYAWKIRDGTVVDSTNHCYGLAFVMLAYASAAGIGLACAKGWVYETFELMEQRFWDDAHGAYACEASARWELGDYRGQNDNMHACEALIAAYEVTRDVSFLNRACRLADTFALRLANATNGHIWEHYTRNWAPDFDYNRNDTSNNIRPWGVQTGHQTDWAKLLLILERHRPERWRLARAEKLFGVAMKYGWDDQFGGLIYGYDLQGECCDGDKYFWVQAESIAAAALLAEKTGDAAYWKWYDRMWDYSYRNFVDHEYGAWYRLLANDNVRYDDRKSYNNKVDYHTMGACYEALNVV
ncbi:MAG: AGE family epimerase/isomerase, partial [Propionivibrio sp.]